MHCSIISLPWKRAEQGGGLSRCYFELRLGEHNVYTGWGAHLILYIIQFWINHHHLDSVSETKEVQHVLIVETYISPCEKKLVGRNVRAVLHSFGGRRHLGGGQGVVVMNTECFLAAPKILPVHFRSKNQ